MQAQGLLPSGGPPANAFTMMPIPSAVMGTMPMPVPMPMPGMGTLPFGGFPVGAQVPGGSGMESLAWLSTVPGSGGQPGFGGQPGVGGQPGFGAMQGFPMTSVLPTGPSLPPGVPPPPSMNPAQGEVKQPSTRVGFFVVWSSPMSRLSHLFVHSSPLNT